jgi:polyhydroxyalkanoate synthesis regulator phasin
LETSEHQDKPDDAGSDADRLSGVRDFVRDAWIQALVAVGASEDEVQKILGKLGGWVEVGPDEARRLAADLSERLRRERGELEKSIESAVQRALGPFRLPNRDQVAEMDARIDQLSERVERLLENRRQS